jgi:hypothetical protein
MVMFDHNTAPTMQGTRVGSLFTTLMNEARAKSASLLRFLYDKEDDESQLLDDNDPGNNRNSSFFDNLIEMEEVAFVAPPHIDHPTFHAAPTAVRAKKMRTKCIRLDQRTSNWWTRFLTPNNRDVLLNNRNGRLANHFRKVFHISLI